VTNTSARIWRFGDDVDTDQIVPGRYAPYMRPDEDVGRFAFVEARPEFARDAAPGDVIVAGRNFGCGSSREHAAWALEDYGFRAILAPSFSDIFRSNAVKSGLAPLEVPEAELDRIKAAVVERNELTVDLEAQEITHPDGLRVPISLDDYARETLIHGLDDVARTLRREERIAAYEASTPARFDTRALA